MAKVGEGLAYIVLLLSLITFTWDILFVKVVASSWSKPLKPLFGK